jgi:hypothetical protein
MSCGNQDWSLLSLVTLIRVMYARILQHPSALHILNVLGANVMSLAPAQRTIQTVKNNRCHAFHLMQLAVSQS